MITGGWRGPGWQVFDADPRLGRPIRDWISSAIRGHGCPVDAGDAAVVVSELFGNAVRHGPAGGRVLVGYCLWRQGARLVVCDGGGPGVPRLVHGGELAEGGRGLRVVDATRGPVGQLLRRRRAGGVVRFRAAAARRDGGRVGLAVPCLVGVRPGCPWPPGSRREAGQAGCRGGSMSARLTRAGAGLHPGRQLPAGRSCRTALPAAPRICVRQATEATCEPPLVPRSLLVAVFCQDERTPDVS